MSFWLSLPASATRFADQEPGIQKQRPIESLIPFTEDTLMFGASLSDRTLAELESDFLGRPWPEGFDEWLTPLARDEDEEDEEEEDDEDDEEDEEEDEDFDDEDFDDEDFDDDFDDDDLEDLDEDLDDLDEDEDEDEDEEEDEEEDEKNVADDD
jgi:hypothetical protein